MSDIISKIKDEYNKAIKDNSLKSIYDKIEKGAATYAEASVFSSKAGQIIAKILDKYLKENMMGDIVPIEVAKSLIPGSLKHNHEKVAEVCEQVQAILNESAGIGLKPLKPFFDDRKAEGIVVEVVNAKSYLDKSIAFMEHVENLSMAAVDKAVKVNADFHSEAGLAPKIKRVSVGKCCEWCQKIVGLYDYEDVKDTGNNVFRRHSNCRCQVQYIPTRGKVKNVHTKR